MILYIESRSYNEMSNTKLREKKKKIIEKLLATMSSLIGSIFIMVLFVFFAGNLV